MGWGVSLFGKMFELLVEGFEFGVFSMYIFKRLYIVMFVLVSWRKVYF